MCVDRPKLLALSLGCVVGLLPGSGAAQGSAGSRAPGARSAFASAMLAAHNEVRAQASPRPQPPLPPLTWSAQAAAKALAWANQCKYHHNPNRGRLGENLAAAAPAGSKTEQAVVRDWAAEAAHYDPDTHSCAPGRMCGHYTQLVWRDTTGVGCATRVCTKNSPFGPKFPRWQLWVCNYTPPGNIVGKRPY